MTTKTLTRTLGIATAAAALILVVTGCTTQADGTLASSTVQVDASNPTQVVTDQTTELSKTFLDVWNNIDVDPTMDRGVVDTVAIDPIATTMRDRMQSSIDLGIRASGGLAITQSTVKDITLPAGDQKNATATVDMCVATAGQSFIGRDGQVIPKKDDVLEHAQMKVLMQNPEFPNAGTWRGVNVEGGSTIPCTTN